MKWALRILAGLGVLLALTAASAFYLLYAPLPPEPALTGRAERHVLRVGALDREYLLYAPARRAAAPPLLVVFHGSMGKAADMRGQTGFGFDRLADRHGFLVVYPQGYEGHWNDCRKAAAYSARRLGIDDVGFFEALVERLRRTRGADSRRVFVAGLSNGGHFAFRLALERPRRIAGAAAFGASLPAAQNNACAAGGPPPPLMLVNGTSDKINPFEGGKVTLFGFGNRGHVLSARDSAAWFAARAGSAGPATSRIAPRAAADPTWVERSVWRSPGGSETMLLAVHGGGHVVPQAAWRPPRLLGRVSTAVDGPEAAWEFFRRQAPSPP